MYEKFKDPLLSKRSFFLRLLHSALIGIIMIAVSLFIGMLGYHFFEKMNWVDSFVNASMILSSMGPLSPLTTTGGKIFAGFYALFSGLIFLVILGVVFAPVIHRFFHHLHLD